LPLFTDCLEEVFSETHILSGNLHFVIQHGPTLLAVALSGV
jgi:hypothetical protein